MNKLLLILTFSPFCFGMDRPQTRVLIGEYCLSKHAFQRMKERKIGQGVLQNALEKGKRFNFDDDTQFCIYEPDNIIAVIKVSRNLVITTYRERNSELCKYRVEKLKKKLAASPDGLLYKKKTDTYKFEDIAKERMAARNLKRSDVLDIIFKGKVYTTYTGGSLYVDLNKERAVHTNGNRVLSVFTGINKYKLDIWRSQVNSLNAKKEQELKPAIATAGMPTQKSIRKNNNKPIAID